MDPRATDIAARLSADARVRLVYVFGSQARGEAGPDHDVDIAVLLDRRLSWDEERHFRAAATRGLSNVDLIILNDAPPVLAHEVITGGSCLLELDADERANFEIGALSRFLDFQPVRRVQQRYMRARIEERLGTANRTTT